MSRKTRRNLLKRDGAVTACSLDPPGRGIDRPAGTRAYYVVVLPVRGLRCREPF